jgi:hypothetical protein
MDSSGRKLTLSTCVPDFFLFCCPFGGFCPFPVTYTITSYPAGLADLPCDAFKKNPDGSWTQVAILVAGGALIVGLHFKNTSETRIIESKCDRK